MVPLCDQQSVRCYVSESYGGITGWLYYENATHQLRNVIKTQK